MGRFCCKIDLGNAIPIKNLIPVFLYFCLTRNTGKVQFKKMKIKLKVTCTNIKKIIYK